MTIVIMLIIAKNIINMMLIVTQDHHEHDVDHHQDHHRHLVDYHQDHQQDDDDHHQDHHRHHGISLAHHNGDCGRPVPEKFTLRRGRMRGISNKMGFKSFALKKCSRT